MHLNVTFPGIGLVLLGIFVMHIQSVDILYLLLRGIAIQINTFPHFLKEVCTLSQNQAKTRNKQISLMIFTHSVVE